MITITGRRMAATLGATSLLLLTLPGMAQTPTAIPQNQAEFEKQLGITADQKKKMEAVGKKYKPQLEKLQTKYKPQVEQLQKQMVALQQQMVALQKKYVAEAQPLGTAQQKEIEGILTPAQRDKMKAIQAAVQQQRSAAGGGGMAPPGQR